jgi:hypothetical protein
MRPAPLLRLLALLLLALAAGCASNNKGKLEGTRWHSDADKYKGKSLPSGFLKLEFDRNGGVIYRAGTHTFTGKYTYGPGDQVIFHLDRELGGSKVHTQTVLVHGDRMVIIDGDGTEMRFQKQ